MSLFYILKKIHARKEFDPDMNATLSLLKQHRSIRKYKPDPIPEEVFNEIIRAAQCAPTSSNMQAYSVVAVTDQEMKTQLAHLAGDQLYIAECPVFLVWCADVNRLKYACEPEGGADIPTSTEIFIIATVDAALAAQNATIAAESLGLGAVYIGGVRNNPQEISDLLELPDLVYPVFGMCLGYPDEQPTIRPRLPMRAVLHHNRYSSRHFADGIAEYNEQLRQYMLTRSGSKRDTTWSKEMKRRLGANKRLHMKAFLEKRGFPLE